MTETRTIGIKELKNKLSAYLREVRTGARILISDRDTVVAELHEPHWDRSPSVTGNPPLSDWISAGTVRLPSVQKKPLQLSPVHLEEGTALKLLDKQRGESYR